MRENTKRKEKVFLKRIWPWYLTSYQSVYVWLVLWCTTLSMVCGAPFWKKRGAHGALVDHKFVGIWWYGMVQWCSFIFLVSTMTTSAIAFTSFSPTTTSTTSNSSPSPTSSQPPTASAKPSLPSIVPSFFRNTEKPKRNY